MVRKVHVTPGKLSRLQAKFGILVAALFLVFGVVLVGSGWQEVGAAEVGLLVALGLFATIWIVACASIIVLFTRVLRRSPEPGANSLVDLEFEDAPDERAQDAPGDFSERLRSLEALKKDGLVSDSEYRQKRAGILGEKW